MMENLKYSKNLQVPDSATEKAFLTNALSIWLKAHNKPVPSFRSLSRQIQFYPYNQDNDVLTPDDESVNEDGE